MGTEMAILGGRIKKDVRNCGLGVPYSGYFGPYLMRDSHAWNELEGISWGLPIGGIEGRQATVAGILLG